MESIGSLKWNRYNSIWSQSLKAFVTVLVETDSYHLRRLYVLSMIPGRKNLWSKILRDINFWCRLWGTNSMVKSVTSGY